MCNNGLITNLHNSGAHLQAAVLVRQSALDEIDHKYALIGGVVNVGRLVLDAAVYSYSDCLLGIGAVQRDLLHSLGLRVVAHQQRHLARVPLQLVDCVVMRILSDVDAVHLEYAVTHSEISA